MKYITIATDISCDAKYKISTWACYIRHEGGTIKKVGRFKDYHKTTATAETYALINALTIAQTIPSFKSSKVIIHNEIEYALSPIRTKYGNVRSRDAARAEAIITMAMPILNAAGDWELRKIKAHFQNWETSDNPAKYAINRWCDMACRQALRDIRKSEKKARKVLAF